MKKFSVLLNIFGVLCLCSFFGCSNPAVDVGQVGYVTNEPMMLGEIGEYLDIIIGPSSDGVGWRNVIKSKASYKPFTVKEYFSPIGGAGTNSKSDTRILSKDKINEEVSTSVVLCIKGSPALPGKYNEVEFKKQAKDYFENYVGFWHDRYREVYRKKIRGVLGNLTYGEAKEQRTEQGEVVLTWLNGEFEGTPISALSVNISNINPPARMSAEQELLKAVEIAESRQSREQKLQEAKALVLNQEAANLQSVLEIAPQFLKWRELSIQEKYADAFNNVVTGDEAKSIKKVVFMPYNTPVAASSEAVN